jgi:Ca2+-binding RTX toxin-like protein
MTYNVAIAFNCIIENAIGGFGHDIIIGNDVANALKGGDGDDSLYGKAGNDLLDGGGGRDYFDGGEGVDMVDYAFTAMATTVNLTTGQATWVAVPGYVETLVSIENARGGSGADTLIGNALANLLEGNAGNDVLSGADGDDTLRGGDGNDILDGGGGRDYFDGGNGIDMVDYAFTAMATTVNLTTGQSTWASVPGYVETLVSIENARGGSGNDVLTGNALANRLEGNSGADVLRGMDGNDVLLGGNGDDLLDGGFGWDWLDGGPGSDTADFAFFGGSTIVNLATGQAQFSGNTGVETLLGIENIRTGAGNDFLTGDGNRNYLDGGAGSDVMRGGGENDTFLGGGARDYLFGDAGADTFYFTTLADSLPGTEDVIYDFARAQGDRINLAAIDANTGLAGNQAFSFVGYGAITGAGQLRIEAISSLGADGFADYLIKADVSGDAVPDFQLYAHAQGLWTDSFIF